MDKLVNALKGDEAGKSKEEGKKKADLGRLGYMRAKVNKLDKQFIEETNVVLAERGKSAQIFKGIVIHVNGYTVPSADELRRLIGQHGGRYHQYYTKSAVTHIIATNLPDSKLRELRGEKVARPEWILDSIAHDKLLPVANYLLCSGRKASQSALSFNRTNNSASNNARVDSVLVRNRRELSKCASGQVEEGSDVSKVDLSDNNSEEENEMIQVREARTFGEPSTSVVTCSKRGDTSAHEIESQCGTGIPQTQQRTNKSPNKGLSTLPKAGDPNFVSEFYNNSRLHYLSTWGAEFKQYTSQLIKERVSQGRIPTKRTGPGMYGRVIMHIDMDSFFVSVFLRGHPELVGKPVAVCHAGKGSEQSSAKGPTSPLKAMATFFSSMSEIASCSYEARSAGVRNGMFLGQARKLCPEIVCVPYLFDQYRQVSQELYEILVSYTHEIEAVSCDEAFLDVTQSLDEHTDPMALAERIRTDIHHATGCNASAGISSSVLLARMCTRLAKPNGQFYLGPKEDVLILWVKDLPGVGWSTSNKLKDMSVETCADLQKISLQALQKDFGPKTGLTLHRSCRGVDDRPLQVERERKSVSAEINYGIRFTEDVEAVNFIDELASEVQKRLRDVGLKGRCVTLKLKVRSEGAPMPQKFMGHGICDNVARSITLGAPTDDSRVIVKECLTLLRQLKIPATDFRGLGIQVSKLEQHVNGSKTLFDFMKPGISKEKSAVLYEQRPGNIIERPSRGIESSLSCETECSTEYSEDLPQTPTNERISTSVGERNNKTLASIELEDNLGRTAVGEEGRSVSPRLRDRLEVSQVADNSFCCPADDGDVLRSGPRPPFRQQMPLVRLSPDDNLPPLPKFTPSPSPGSVHRPGILVVPSQAAGTSGAAPEGQFLPSPCQIDLSVLDALPADVREGIERHYAERNQEIHVRGGQINRELFVRPSPSKLNAESERQLQIAASSEGGNALDRVPGLVPGPYRHSIFGELPSPSQLDPEYLAALPKELREELQQAYRTIGEPAPTTKRTVNSKVSEEQNKASASRTACPGNSRNEIEDVPDYSCPVSLGGAVTLQQVKAVIHQWTCTPVPLEEDVEEVSSYLLQLIESRNLDQMWSVLKYFIRCVRPKGMEDWRDACHVVVDRVQAVIIGVYGSRLPIERCLYDAEV